MNADEHDDVLEQTAAQVASAARQVAATLGPGYDEGVYRAALAEQLRQDNVLVQQLSAPPVWIDGLDVGEHSADLLVADRILIEVRADHPYPSVHRALCASHLQTTGHELYLLLHFTAEDQPHITALPRADKQVPG